jgi:hypothetical protein
MRRTTAFSLGKMPGHLGAPLDHAVEALNRVGNRYESFSVPMFRCDIQDRSVWCDHRDRGTGSTKVRAGRCIR